jgi:hypothetical protein
MLMGVRHGAAIEGAPLFLIRARRLPPQEISERQ